jgi:hypothetical protein
MQSGVAGVSRRLRAPGPATTRAPQQHGDGRRTVASPCRPRLTQRPTRSCRPPSARRRGLRCFFADARRGKLDVLRMSSNRLRGGRGASPPRASFRTRRRGREPPLPPDSPQGCMARRAPRGTLRSALPGMAGSGSTIPTACCASTPRRKSPRRTTRYYGGESFPCRRRRRPRARHASCRVSGHGRLPVP